MKWRFLEEVTLSVAHRWLVRAESCCARRGLPQVLASSPAYGGTCKLAVQQDHGCLDEKGPSMVEEPNLLPGRAAELISLFELWHI